MLAAVDPVNSLAARIGAVVEIQVEVDLVIDVLFGRRYVGLLGLCAGQER